MLMCYFFVTFYFICMCCSLCLLIGSDVSDVTQRLQYSMSHLFTVDGFALTLNIADKIHNVCCKQDFNHLLVSKQCYCTIGSVNKCYC